MKHSAFRFVGVILALNLLLTACAGGHTPAESTPVTTTTARSTTTAPSTSVTTASSTVDSETESTTVDATAESTASTTTTRPEPIVTTTAPKTTVTTTIMTTTTAPTLSPVQQKRNEIGFGYYRMGSIEDGLLEAIEEEAAKGHMNVYMTGMAPYNFQNALTMLRKVKEVGGMTWLGIAETVFLFRQPVELIENWKENLQNMMDVIEEEGLMDNVLGFYFDEPMLCGIQKAEFRDVTKYLRETWPELRTMAIFAINAISPDVWSSGNDQVLDYDTTQYLTDAGYDMYGTVAGDGINTYKKINADLKTRLGRDDVRIWYVPCIMSYHGSTDQLYAINHLKAMYEFLMEEENPGGLFCYAYDISNRDGIGNIGFRELRERERNPWTALEQWLVHYGKEIQKVNQ